MRPQDSTSLTHEYLNELFAPLSDLQKESIEFMNSTGKLGMSVSPNEARSLGFFIEAFHCKKVIELGCFAGFSALSMADAMSGGDLFTFELNEEHADFSENLFAKYTGSTKIHLIQGDARQKLDDISDLAPFDLIFIDANKAAYYDYLVWAEDHLKKDGLIIGDNTMLFGELGNPKPEKVSASQWKNMRKFNERLADRSKYSSCFIPTSEGLTIARKIF